MKRDSTLEKGDKRTHCLSKPRQQTESKPSPSVHAINTESLSSCDANNHNETIKSNTEHSRLSGKVNDYAFHIRDHDSTKKKPTVEVHINGAPVQCVIDTGASVMVMGPANFQRPYVQHSIRIQSQSMLMVANRH